MKVLASVFLLTLALLHGVAFAGDQPPSKPVTPGAELRGHSYEDCASLLTDAIPTAFIKKMFAEGNTENPQFQRLREIVQRQGFAPAVVRQSILNANNHNFTVELAQGPITNQAQSGRCWIFAGLNMIRSGLISNRLVPADFQFSENYLHFFNMLEKSGRYMERVLDKTIDGKSSKGLTLKEVLNPQLGDGGWYEYFQFLVNKYGLAPKSAMPETRGSGATAAMNAELARYLSGVAAEMTYYSLKLQKEGKAVNSPEIVAKLREVKLNALRGAWKILATHLGSPPAEFEFRVDTKVEIVNGKKVTQTNIRRFTPQEFAQQVAQYNPHDYVVVTNYPRREVGKTFEVKGSAIGPAEPNMPAFNLRFLNLDMKRLEELTVAMIDDGQAVWFGADVTKDVEHGSGVMHPELFDRNAVYDFSPAETMARLPRDILTLFNMLEPNHAMTITGYDRPDVSKPVVKFKNENSWGDNVGHKGVYNLYREWFHENVFQVVINKKHLTAAELASWTGKPIELTEKDDLF